MKQGQTSIFGFARSGFAVAKLLEQEGKSIFVTERKLLPELPAEQQEWLRLRHVPSELGGHTEVALERADEIVVSPGVPWDLPLLQSARQKGISVISELEFASRRLVAPIVAVTGTNGKTTTTTLIGEIFKAAGRRVAVGGNIGVPAATLVGQDIDVAVLEVSSYQLEGVQSFRPHVSVILNITPDHMERHRSVARYGDIKAKIFERQTKSDFCIFNGDDPEVQRIIGMCPARPLAFGRKGKGRSAYLDMGRIQAEVNLQPRIDVALDECLLPGEHNAYNMMAAALAALSMDVPAAVIEETLHSFRGVPHRIEHMGSKDGVDFYNDSKATNPESSVVAMRALAQPGEPRIILLAGGRDKGTDLSLWVETVRQTAKHVILFGEATERFSEALSRGGFSAITKVASLEEAADQAERLARTSDCILLSPACASFDMFVNFEERGDRFRALVQNKLKARHASKAG